MNQLRKVGRPTRRVDAREKVLGEAVFTHDLRVPGMLVAKVLRSPLPHAEIVRLDVSPALSVPGVVAAITSEDFVDHGNWGFPVKDDYMLSYRKVRCVGDPIAAVAAESLEAALAGLAAIDVELKELPAVFDMESALLEDAPLIHDELTGSDGGDDQSREYLHIRPVGNISETHKVIKGDPAATLTACPVTMEGHYSVAHQEHAYLETEAALAIPTSDGGVTVYVGDQSPFITHGNLMATLGLPAEKVRCIQPYVGGAFGGKSDLVYECAAQAAKLALISGRPVKLATSREESMVASYKRDAMEMHFRLGADRDGRLRAAQIELWADSGAYASQTPFTGWRATIHAMGPYRYDDCHVHMTGVYTNNGYSGAFRGFGNTEVVAASEQAIDELAEKCGLDPLEFRLRNCLVVGDETPHGQLLEESVGIRQCLERARQISEWDRKRAEYARQDAGRERRRGIGLACFYHGCSLGAEGLDYATHTIRIETDNRLAITSGLTDYGQGSRTVFCLIAAEALGLPLERFYVRQNDTDYIHDCGPTVASRSTILGGNATRLAAMKLLNELHGAAAMMFGCELPLVQQDGETFVGPAGQRAHLAVVTDYARRMGLALSASARWEMPRIHWSMEDGRGRPYYTYHYGVQVAEVLVDRRTGVTQVLHIYAVHDVGKVIFPEGAAGQLYGGISQGVGYALMERVEFERGRVLNTNLDTYLIPTAADMPPMTVEFVEEQLSSGPYGAKNVAEPSMVPTAPAILNAIYQATGRRIHHLPANLERVLLGRDLRDTVTTICEDDTCERGRCELG